MTLTQGSQVLGARPRLCLDRLVLRAVGDHNPSTDSERTTHGLENLIRAKPRVWTV